VTSNPLEAEATGQEFVEAAFGGATFRVPLDVDSWPLDTIRRCRGVMDGELVVNYRELVISLKSLLGEQWSTFEHRNPKRKQLVPASLAFAAAVGIPASNGADIVFGAVPRLLSLIDQWPLKVESDLRQFWQLEYRDRWLFQAGRRRLTLRQIHGCMSNLPTGSAVAIAMNGGRLHLTGTDLLLMDLFELQSRRRHPSRPMSPEQLAERAAALAAEEKAKAAYRAKHDKPKPQNAIEAARANAKRAQERSPHAEVQDV
jgi:hypothetical protein